MESNLMIDITEENLNYINFTNVNSLNRICRTCLTERGELNSLFSDRITEMLISFTTIQIGVNDGLPTHICSQCVLNVSRAFTFKQQAESSDATLRQYINNFNNPQATLPNILEMGYDIENIQMPVTQDTTNDILSSDSKNNYYLVDNSTIEPLLTKEEEVKLIKDETSKIFDNSSMKSVKDEILNIQQTEPSHEVLPELDDNCLDNNVDLSNKDDFLKLENKFDDELDKNAFILTDDNDIDDDFSDTEYFVCKICNAVCKDSKDWNKHMKKHDKSKIHECSECGKTFHKKVGLKSHMRRHGVGEKKHLCPHCGKRFFEVHEYMIHTRTHTGERPIVCDTCGKSFADPRSLAKHIKIHTGEKKFECEICNKRFIHSYTLTAHRRVHTGEKPFVCSTCGHACATSTQLTLHTRTHTHEKPYRCTLCPKSFTSRSGLSTHQMTHTGERKYICSVCGKGARTSTDLASHTRTHTGERPYLCKIPTCTKKYKTHSQLSAHMRTHTGEKRHKCSVCGKAFADSSQLKCHMNIHTGAKPYCCGTCGQRFTQSGSLYTHMKIHHRQTLNN